MTFAELFDLTIRQKNIMNSVLARRSGVDHSHISRLRTGARFPTAEMIDKLAEGLELSLQETNNLRVAAGYLPRDRAVRDFIDLPADLRHQLIEIAEILLREREHDQQLRRRTPKVSRTRGRWSHS